MRTTKNQVHTGWLLSAKNDDEVAETMETPEERGARTAEVRDILDIELSKENQKEVISGIDKLRRWSLTDEMIAQDGICPLLFVSWKVCVMEKFVQDHNFEVQQSCVKLLASACNSCYVETTNWPKKYYAETIDSTLWAMESRDPDWDPGYMLHANGWNLRKDGSKQR